MQIGSDWRDRRGIHPYDLNDLAYDAPNLFKFIFNTAVDAYDGFGFDPNRIWAYQKETDMITAAQWAVFGGQSAQPKTNFYDYEIYKIKNDVLWSGLQPTDTVEIVFWQDSFDSLVSFARRTKHPTIVKLLDVRYDELKEAGFSYDLIAKIVTILRDWAEKLLNPDAEEYERDKPANEKDEDVSQDIASKLLSMFFVDESAGMEEGNDDGEQPADTRYADYP